MSSMLRTTFASVFALLALQALPAYAQDSADGVEWDHARSRLQALPPGDMHMAQIYDCYTITVMLSLEDAGFCAKGKGMDFLRNNDFTF